MTVQKNLEDTGQWLSLLSISRLLYRELARGPWGDLWTATLICASSIGKQYLKATGQCPFSLLFNYFTSILQEVGKSISKSHWSLVFLSIS
jgi:hypothetical protein